ncbi:MAG TPA: pyrimidine reductase family protein [Jatrophihabitans sp.]|jgi:riboflavin biosynthesis pyrimidine reductase|nr:pyrimidine reductase family protein [Jatrophihabitans sp.]
MRALLPTQADDVDLHAFYAADWLDSGGLRVNFVSSVDGAAQAFGKSAGLQTAGDNAVFGALRDLADVIVAGAGTVTIEGYQAVVVSDERAETRRNLGLRDTLPTAVISRSLRLDPASGLFTDAPAQARTIVLTCEAAPAQRRVALEQVADVAVCGGEMVDLTLARAALEERGLTRILSEGGPTAFAQLADAGVVDELCLSFTPMLIGPGPGRITAGSDLWGQQVGLRLVGLLEEDGALFLRYRTG